MKNLVLGALLAAAVSATACTASTPTDAVITARWSFSTYANRDSAPTDPCPAGFDTASIYARPWDPFLGEFVGSFEPPDKFNCSDKVGTTLPLDGIFQVWVQIESHDGSAIYAQSESLVIDTADGDASIELPTLFKDAGFFDLTWDLVRSPSSSTRLHCSEAGIGPNGSITTTEVSVASPSFMVLDKFTCEDGFGISDVLPVDRYDVSVTASAAPGQDLGTPALVPDVVIRAPNGLTHLGHVKIVVGP